MKSNNGSCGMKVGLDEIEGDSRYGMPVSHMRALINASRASDTPLGMRPVSRFAKHFLMVEGCPTKPFVVKNKSANLGIAAGLIPVNPRYGRDPEGPQNYQKSFNKALQDPTLTTIPLTLSRDRLFELNELFGNNISITLDASFPQEAYKISWLKNGKEVHAYALADQQGGAFAVVDDQREPLHVLSKTILRDGLKRAEPVTADYDLLVVCPTYKTLDPGTLDKTPIRTQGKHDHLINTMGKINSPDYHGPSEVPGAGNWSPRVQGMVEQINRSMAAEDPLRCGEGVETVHHNAEFYNPYAADLQDNLPALLVFPHSMDLSHIVDAPNGKAQTVDAVLIESREEMCAVRNFLQKEGYYWPTHMKYAEELRPFHEKAVSAAEEGIAFMKARLSALRHDAAPEKIPVDKQASSQNASEDTNLPESQRRDP